MHSKGSHRPDSREPQTIKAARVLFDHRNSTQCKLRKFPLHHYLDLVDDLQNDSIGESRRTANSLRVTEPLLKRHH